MIARRTFLAAGLAAPFVVPETLRAQAGERLTIALLPGLGYAPLKLAKNAGWIEAAIPGLKVDWLEIASSAAIREGMLSGDIDAGAGSVAPFLIGRDRGFKVGLISSLTIMDLLLLTNDPAVKALRDFDSSKKIAVTAPDTNQAFVLRLAAQQTLGDAKALDGSFLAMPHPDALQALVTNQIAGYMGSPPFQNEAIKRGCRMLLNSRDIVGPLTFSVCFALETYGKKRPANVQAIRDAIGKGIALLKSRPEEAAKMLAAESGGRQSSDDFTRLLADPSTTFTDELVGVPKLAEFMKSSGFLRADASPPASMMLKG
ncbi:NitT/TauT family transport system substrate-binding protein [Nitrobacteraceae bacterium AZCC 2146]